ncbi:pilus assembly protein TadG-related protein [Actinomyces wuliandei]|uniref:pilus assembly protein TadG-related protein n=1 Tax=Actinomyces wuliandei TaxID=2057743 RepID=UPI001FA98E8F|nr:pilus assembly protein TadG-related protein [Actinomyces wuliandei]
MSAASLVAGVTGATTVAGMTVRRMTVVAVTTAERGDGTELSGLRRQRGSLSVFVVVIAAVLLLLAGLCIEGGRVLNARATLTDQAEQAARSGAQQLADHGVRQGSEVTLDTRAAGLAARSYLAGVGLSGSSEVSVGPSTVTVTVERDVPTAMLRLVGLRSVHVTTTGEARTATGIYEEGDL